MLFSNKDLAAFLQDRFEPAWESVRAVPTVTLDFGEGHVLRRTLHGNVATYVCDSQGRVLDVIPGMYEPGVYRERLAEAGALAAGARLWAQARDHDSLRAEYHRARLGEFVGRRQRGAVDRTKTIAIEGPLEDLVRQPKLERGPDVAKREDVEGPLEDLVRRPGASPEATPAVLDRIPWDSIRRDTRHNETVRRRKIHELLSAPRPFTPATLTKVIYRDVLGTDLEDPYLGLRGALMETYPFER